MRALAISVAAMLLGAVLAPDNYRTGVTVNDKAYSWSFAIAPNDSASAAR